MYKIFLCMNEIGRVILYIFYVLCFFCYIISFFILCFILVEFLKDLSILSRVIEKIELADRQILEDVDIIDDFNKAVDFSFNAFNVDIISFFQIFFIQFVILGGRIISILDIFMGFLEDILLEELEKDGLE